MLPTGLPLYFVPMRDAHSSSIGIMPFSWHISSNGSSSTACPVKSTATTALVLSVIFSFYFAGINIVCLWIDICKNRLCATIQGALVADAAKVIGL